VLKACAEAVALLFSGVLAAPAMAANCTWNTTTGNWATSGDWASCGVVVPGGSDTANILTTGVVTINTGQSVLNLNNAGQINIDAFGLNLVGGGSTTNTGTINVGSGVTANLGVSAGHNINNTSGVINTANGSVVNQFGSSITGGTINTTGTGKLVAFNSGSNFLSGVTLNGTLDLASGTGIERISSGLTLNGAINVNSNSILAFQGDQTIGGTGTISLGNTGASNRISTEAGNLTLGSGITINGQNGTIGGQIFVGGPATLTNNGTISASVAGGQINLAVAGGGLTTNNGVLSAQNGGNLLLSSAVTNAGSGHIDAIGAGSVVTQGGVTITGGTLNTSGGGTFVATNNGSNRLAGVTLNGTLDLASNTGLELVTGNLDLGASGAVNINSNSVLGLQADTVSGNGTVTFGSTGASNRLTIEAGDSVIGSGVLVHGQNGTIGGQIYAGGTATLTNNGTISADVSGGTITLGVNGTVTNNGTLSALNGGTLVLNNSINGTPGSSIVVGAGSTLLQNGVTLNGVVNSSGTGNFLVSNSAANTLNGVTFSGNLNLASNTSLERALNGLTLTPGSTISINSNSVFALQDETLGGSGTVTFGSTGASNRLTIEAGDSVIGSGILVHGQNGTIGGQVYVGGTATLTNNGTISADVAGGTISIGINSAAANAVTNNGVLSAANGGTLVLNSNVTGNTGSFITVGAGSRVFQNGVTLTGVINNAGTGSFQASNSASNTLNAVTFTGPLDLSTATSEERALNGLTFGAGSTVSINNNSILGFQNEEIGGTAVITFGNTGASNRVTIEAGATVLDAGITIQGQNGTVGGQVYAGGAATLANAGVITANVDQGTINLSVNGLTTNTGTLSAQNGGTLMLNSAVTNAGSGHIDALGGGTAGSRVLQNGIAITGGTLNTSGAGTIVASNSGSNFLSGVTLAGTLDLASGTAQEQISGGSLVLNSGVININSNSILALQADTVSGNGTITFGSTGASNRLNIEAGNSVIGSGVTIHGQNGTIGNQNFAGGAATLTNNGVITADTGGGLITLSVSGLTTNNATLSAQNGSTLQLNSAVTNGASGHIDAIGSNSVVIQNAVTITGGTLNTSGGGRFAASNSGSNFLANTTLAGTLDLASATGQERLLNTTLTLASGGVVNINSNSILDLQASTVNGTGTINLGAAGSSNRIAIEAGTSTIGAGVTIQGQNGTFGNQFYAGGAATLINNGTISANVAGGLISLNTASYVNNGTLSATAGVLSANTGFTGTGTALTSGTGQLIVGAASTVGNLINNGTTASALTLGTNNITVSSDYNNANFGAGNSFNRRAGISGTGQVLAGGNAAQAITGTGVTNGNTANATLTIGNVRVGATTFDYQVANTGSTGPSLRGAIQTTANGSNLTDNRLSGSGVTASNYNTGAPGSNTGNLGVTFTAANAGALAPLSGQVLNLTSNFSNIADQKLNIVLGSAAAAYNAAVGSAAPNPVTVANQRIGGSNTAALTVSNTATAGSFSEDLNASFGSNTGSATNTGGAANGVLAGGSNASSMLVGVNTGTAGAKTGTVTVNYQTAGAVNGASNGLGTASVGSQAVTVNGNVYQVAAGLAQSPVQVANQRIGGSNTTALIVGNNNTFGTGFIEDLNASVASTSGATASGNLSGIVAGRNNLQSGAGSILAGVDTNSAGSKTGTVTLNYQTAGAVNGVSNGLGTLGVGSQAVTITGNVYQAAAGTIQTAPLNFGTVQVGQSVSQNLVIRNTASGAAGFVEDLNASFGTSTGASAGLISGSGSLSGILAGTNSAGGNGTMTVTVNTSAAGNITGGINVNYETAGKVNGVSNGLGTAAVGSENYGVSGVVQTSANVVNAASPVINNSPINLGNVRVGAVSPTGLVSITNQATTAPQAALNANISGNGAITANGSFNLLGPGATDSTNLQVGMNTATAGNKSGTATLSLVSDASNIGNCGANCQMNLASQNVQVQGAVYRMANNSANLTQVTPTVTIAARVGDSVAANQAVSITNTSPDIYTEGLKVNVTSATGNAQSNGGGIANLAAQSTDNSTIKVGLANTATAGVNNGQVTLGLTSTGAGTTGAADTSVGSAIVNVVGKVYQQAVALVNTTPVNFGIVHVGDSVTAQNVSVTNNAPVTGLNDVLLGSISANGPFSGSGSLGTTGLSASATDASSLMVGLNTGTAGLFSGQATVGTKSHNADMADLNLADQQVSLSATVNNYAVADIQKAGGAGSLSRSGNTFTLDFGTLTQGTGSVDALLEALNNVVGLSDLLRGYYNVIDGNDFSLSGFAAFSGLAAGGAAGPLDVSFNTSNLGMFTDELTLLAQGYNSSGYSDEQDLTLIIKANVVTAGVPEPGSLALIGIALVALVTLRRRSGVQQRG
jgi:hypothetical protein